MGMFCRYRQKGHVCKLFAVLVPFVTGHYPYVNKHSNTVHSVPFSNQSLAASSLFHSLTPNEITITVVEGFYVIAEGIHKQLNYQKHSTYYC